MYSLCALHAILHHMSHIPKKESRFSIVARAKSFNHAWRGIRLFFMSTHNAWIQVCIGALMIGAGIFFAISHYEWIALIFAIGTVLATEAMNTAFEIDIDLTSPEYHPYARDTKDVAAGAVLITTIMASIIGALIFVPKIIALF